MSYHCFGVNSHRRSRFRLGQFKDDFSNRAGGWPSIVNDRGDEAGYADGKYRVRIRVKPEQVAAGQIAGIPLAGIPPKKHFQKLIAEVDAVQQTGPSDAVFGLSCGPSTGELYPFVVNADGYYFIFLDDAISGKATLLQSGRSSNDIRGLGQNNRLRVECSGGSADASLAFVVNGTRLSDARGRRNETFQFVAFFVTTLHAIANSTRADIPGVDNLHPGTPNGFDAEVLFDDFLVRALPSPS